MRPKHIVLETLILVMVIPAVILLFRLIPDRKTASVFAGALFVGVPAALSLWRWCRTPRPYKTWWLSIAQFWFVFAVPILAMRLLNWEAEFDSLSWMGLGGREWHQYANKSFILMLLGVLLSDVLQWKRGPAVH